MQEDHNFTMVLTAIAELRADVSSMRANQVAFQLIEAERNGMLKAIRALAAFVLPGSAAGLWAAWQQFKQ